MPHFWLRIAYVGLGLAFFGTLTSAVSFLLALAGGINFRLRKNNGGSYTPPVSVLKPLHGKERGLEENLESFFRLDYPDYELIFCARSLADPGILCAQEVARQFPSVPARFIASGEPAWVNPKIFSMSIMLEIAKNETIVFSDSDVRVGRDYLRGIVQPLADPHVGLVTCAFRGRSSGGFPSRFAALSQTVEFASGVLTANLIEDIEFGLGPTLLTRKTAIEEIGGLKDMQNLLADDFWLGTRLAQKGYSVVLSSTIVDHCVDYRTFGASLQHQLGWMKNTRRSRPAGHFGSGLTYAMPFGLLGLLCAVALGRPGLGLGLLLAALANRWLQSLLIGYFVMRDKAARNFFWLNPLCDLFSFAYWVASYFGCEILYRGERYRLNPGGVLARVGPRKRATPH